MTIVERHNVADRGRNKKVAAKATKQAATTGDPELSGRLRAAQLAAIVRLTPYAMCASMAGIAVLYVQFQHHPLGILLAMIFAYMCVVAALGLFAWFRSRSQGEVRSASSRATRNALSNAVAAALPWALVALLIYPLIEPNEQLLVATIVAGVVATGAFTLTTAPGAALTYTWLILGCAMIALVLDRGETGWMLAGGVAAYGAYLTKTVLTQAAIFSDKVRNLVTVERQREVIQRLLVDFEAQATDWRFETDARGHLVHLSQKLADVLAVELDRLIGKPFGSVLGAATSGAQTVLLAMLEGRPFRDVEVMRDVEGRPRYWRVSANPVLDETGKVTGFRGVVSDTTDARLATQQLAQLARYDGVTGLPNRALFREDLERAFEDSRRYRDPFAVLLVNLDQFKSVNELLGHDGGDRVLKMAGERIRDVLGEGARIARLAADEFAVLQAVGIQPTASAQLAGRIVSALAAPFVVDRQAITIGACVGVAVAPQDGADASSLLRNADLALHRAKGEGRGHWRFYEAGMDAAAADRRALEADLRRAVENRELTVHFQPITNAETGEVTACEALIRWNHPARGMVSPALFIPIAEEAGLIDLIGEQVLKRATAEAATWLTPARVAVNLSAVQFKNHGLLSNVVLALAESGLPASRLELEVTESVLLDADEQTAQILTNLRALGVKIALDDFGTGYSSLSYLSKFPFDKIKIDRSFVKGITERAENAAIVKTITELARTLGMRTTAEGVETQQQMDQLKADGVTELQGFFLGRPMPAKDIAERLTPLDDALPRRRAVH